MTGAIIDDHGLIYEADGVNLSISTQYDGKFITFTGYYIDLRFKKTPQETLIHYSGKDVDFQSISGDFYVRCRVYLVNPLYTAFPVNDAPIEPGGSVVSLQSIGERGTAKPIHDDWLALSAACQSCPTDATVWGAFADFLDEHEQPERAAKCRKRHERLMVPPFAGTVHAFYVASHNSIQTTPE